MLPSGRRDASGSEDTPPDWGGDDDDSDSTTEVAKPTEREAEECGRRHRRPMAMGT